MLVSARYSWRRKLPKQAEKDFEVGLKGSRSLHVGPKATVSHLHLTHEALASVALDADLLHRGWWHKRLDETPKDGEKRRAPHILKP